MLLEFILYYKDEVSVSALPNFIIFYSYFISDVMTLICTINNVCGLLWSVGKSFKSTI